MGMTLEELPMAQVRVPVTVKYGSTPFCAIDERWKPSGRSMVFAGVGEHQRRSKLIENECVRDPSRPSAWPGTVPGGLRILLRAGCASDRHSLN